MRGGVMRGEVLGVERRRRWSDEGKRCRRPTLVQLDGLKFQGSSLSILLAG